MFCPNCGTKNIEGASFCRACGVDISFVPQAMTGQFSATDSGKTALEKQSNSRRAKTTAPPDVGKGIENLFLGVGFMFVALAIWRFMPGGFVWWFWMLIPAFALIGQGVSQIVRANQRSSASSRAASAINSIPSAPVEELSSQPLNTAELIAAAPPLSVTEQTTRHLSAEPQRKKIKSS